MIVRWPLVKKLKNNYIQCLACSRHCIIPPGETGVCGVRKNVNGKLDLIVYGKPAALGIDPIEKKPLFHFLPGTTAYSLGTYGCNFMCQFCQNWELSQAYREGLDTSFYYDLPPKIVVQEAKRYSASTIAYTYNEPIIWYEYARDIGRLARKEGLFNVFVSSGYETKTAWAHLARFLDAVNIDLKAFTDKFYRQYTKATLKPVLESIKEAKKRGIWVEVTTLIIPGLNDSEDEIREAARFLKSVDPEMPWHLTAFHPDYKMLDRPRTRAEELIKLRKVALEEGLSYVYVGNVQTDYENTYCPKCGALLVRREGFKSFVVNLDVEHGTCRRCGEKIAGIWNKKMAIEK